MPWRPWEEVLALVELAAPSACAGCQAPGARWCPECSAVLGRVRPRAWRPSPCPPGLPPTWAGLPYEGAVRSAVVAWKEQGRADLTPALAAGLGQVLALALRESPPHARAVAQGTPLALVPAPSARSSSRARGRRPVAELTAAAARRDLVVEALGLTRRVRDQAGLHAQERATNLAGAVAVRPAAARCLLAVPCVLVDDVVTTGATLQECARALRAAGSGPVVAVTLAATRRRPAPPLPRPGRAD